MKKQFLLLAVAIGLAASLQAQMIQQASFKTTTKDEAVTHQLYIQPKILQKFHADFRNVSDDAWMKTKEGLAVRFSQNGIQELAFLTNKGECTDYIRYYFEKQLPLDVRTSVKSTYFDYQIKSVQEVMHEGTTAYLVTIEDEKNWMTVRIVNGEMDVYERHQKS